MLVAVVLSSAYFVDYVSMGYTILGSGLVWYSYLNLILLNFIHIFMIGVCI